MKTSTLVFVGRGSAMKVLAAFKQKLEDDGFAAVEDYKDHWRLVLAYPEPTWEDREVEIFQVENMGLAEALKPTWIIADTCGWSKSLMKVSLPNTVRNKRTAEAKGRAGRVSLYARIAGREDQVVNLLRKITYGNRGAVTLKKAGKKKSGLQRPKKGCSTGSC